MKGGGEVAEGSAADVGLPRAPRDEDRFAPALWTAAGEGYGISALKADSLAGLTVAIVALPLSMAIAIASGATPAQGLTTAIVGGFLVSAFGGSRFQIGGPAGAFIVLIAATVVAHGMDGLSLATFLSGLMLTLVGVLRLGGFIRLIPFPVTVGFTAGIAIIIFASQISPLLGLNIKAEPGPLAEKLPVLWAALPGASPAAIGLSLATIAVILVLRRFRPGWPGLLIAVATATATAAALDLPVATIASEFGGIPGGLPMPGLPDFTLAKVVEVLPSAFSFTLLGAIESLLSAVVADGMTGRRHRPNAEMVAQGLANIGSALFGGFCVTGTIARTATNVRAGATGPVAGMLHAVFLLIFVLAAAPLAGFIPLAALAGVLAVVSWNMLERDAILTLVRSGWGEATVLAVTFLLTIFRDLTEAIVVGFALGSVLFIHRISQTVGVEAEVARLRSGGDDPARLDEARGLHPEIVVFRITGAFFFGAAASVGSVLDAIGDRHRALVVDFAQVPLLDATGAHVMEGLARKAMRRDIRLYVTGARPDVRAVLLRHGIRPPHVGFHRTIEDAIEAETSLAPHATPVDPGPRAA